MLKKTPLILLKIGLVTALAIILSGCSTEEPWKPDPSRSLELTLVSAPDTSAAIPHDSNIGFNWISKGGSGSITGYQWYLSPVETGYGPNSLVTSVTYSNVAGADGGAAYTFYVRVTDSDDNTVSDFTSFAVADTVFPAPDTTAPTVEITQSPAESSHVATGSSVEFAWAGDDGRGLEDTLQFQYAFPAMADSSEWGTATTVTFVDVAAADPAIFYVRCRDQDVNVSEWDSVGIVIKDATILYVDDYLWSAPAKDRDQKQFYRDVLEGYAFAEWDIALQGMPDSSDLVVAGEPVYSTIVFCSDSDIGTTDATWWYEVGAIPGGGVMDHYLESGGNLLVTGPLVLLDMTQEYPPEPEPGHFEYDWFGIDSTSWCWDYWYSLSWVIKDTATTLNVADSMKIDVAKNGAQDDYAIETPGLRNDATVTTEVIFRWHYWLDGSEPTPFGNPVGHVTSFDGTPRTAMLNFDTYSMPLSGVRQTFEVILAEFGE